MRCPAEPMRIPCDIGLQRQREIAAVSVAYHDDDLTELDQLTRDWRATAEELADPGRREVLLGGFVT